MPSRSQCAATFFAALISASPVLLDACSNQSGNASDVKYLTQNPEPCTQDQARAAYLQTNLQPAISGDDGTASQTLALAWSALPNVFTDYIVQRVQAGKLSIQFGDLGQWAGLTTGGINGVEPVMIQLSPKTVNINAAAAHELGHAVEAFSYRMSGNQPSAEAQDVEQTYEQVMQSSDTDSMWSYAQTNQYEWFASAFSQYWCSKHSQDEMQQLFPASYSYFQRLYKNLASSQTTGSGSGSGAVSSGTTSASNNAGLGQGGASGTSGGVNDGVSGTQLPVSPGMTGTSAAAQITASAIRLAPGQTISICLKAAASCAQNDWQFLNFTRHDNGRNVFTLPSTISLTPGQRISFLVMTGTLQETQDFIYRGQ